MTCRLRWCVEMENRYRIPIWRTFGRIQWYVISEPRITLQGVATWWIHCHDSRATCHIAGCKNFIRHIENRFSPYFIFWFLFLMQFRLWRAAAFVSSLIHLLLLNVAAETNVTLPQSNTIMAVITDRSLAENGARTVNIYIEAFVAGCGNITETCSEETDRQNMQQDLRALISRQSNVCSDRWMHTGSSTYPVSGRTGPVGSIRDESLRTS